MTKKHYPVFLLTILLLSIITNSPLWVEAQASPAGNDANQSQLVFEGIPDIPAQELKFDPIVTPANSELDNNYIRIYNKAVNYYNRGAYLQAIPLFESIASRYNDRGRVLYLLGLSYYYNQNYEAALKPFHYALDAGYEPQKVREGLTETLFKLGYRCSGKFDYKEAIGYYKAALQYQDDTPSKSNVVYCYLQLAKGSKSPVNTVLLLYAYDFIQAAGLRDDSLEIVANNLCRYVLQPPSPELFDRTIACLRDSLAQKDDPYLHQTLGVIYLYQNNDPPARAEFKKVIDDYKNSEFYPVCLDRYNDTGTAVYHYRAEYPVFISGNIASLPSLVAKILLQAPQSYEYQTTKSLKLILNDRKIPYEVVTDNFGTKCLSCKIEDGFGIGKNLLVIEGDVEVASKRISPEALQNMTLSSYNTGDPRYKLLTARTEAADTLDSRVQKIVKDIKLQLKNPSIKDLVWAVYNYVINTMEYRVTRGVREKVSLKRALASSQWAVCEDYAILTVTLLRALGIPAAYFAGDTYNEPVGHAWAVFYTPDYRPLPLDATWGDTSNMPELYFLRNSNLNVVKSFSYDSNLMPEVTSIKFNTTSSVNITAELGESSVSLKKMNE
jgi:transglutaminase-like putative cysteine protease